MSQWFAKSWFLIARLVLLPSGMAWGWSTSESWRLETAGRVHPTVTTVCILFLMSFSLDSGKLRESFRTPRPVLWGTLVLAIVLRHVTTDACLAELQKHGVGPDAIDLVSVPGALEIPVVLQTMAHTQKYHALIAIGAVIRGETYHFEIVANESCRGVMDVTLQTGVPIANGILTVNTDEQALARTVEKGADCARVAIEMAQIIKAVSAPKREQS